MNVYKYTSKFTKQHRQKNLIHLDNLPWSKIFLRINRLINQIYFETKKHNIEHVYRLQMYMVNSIELKIFVFKYIISELYSLYYLDINKKLNRYTEQQTKRIKSFNLEINLKRVIKEHLMYICINPMFDARSSSSWKQICKSKTSKYYFKKNSHYHYQNIKYIEKKLKIPSYIKESIMYYLETVNYIDLLKFYESKYKINIDNLEYLGYVNYLKYNNFLSKILDKLNLTDSMWYKFNYIKKVQYRVELLDNNNFDISNISKSLKYYLKFRFLLKKAKFFKYLKFIRNKNSLTQKLFSIYQNWYDKMGKFIYLLDIRSTNNLINQAIYLLIKKQRLTILLNGKSVRAVNLLVNKTIYIFNIKRYYIYLT